MTTNRLQTYWAEARKFVKQKWPKLSETELDRIDANFDRLLATIVEHYGNFPASEAEARQLLDQLFDQLDPKAPPELR